MERFGRQEQEIFSLRIDEEAKSYMLEASRWARFLAIIGFVVMFLLLVGGILLAFFASALGISAYGGGYGMGMVIFYIIIVTINFYPVYALFRFASNSRQALHSSNQQLFNRSLFYLKSQFKFWGIFTIVAIVLYGLSLILTIINVAGNM